MGRSIDLHDIRRKIIFQKLVLCYYYFFWFNNLKFFDLLVCDIYFIVELYWLCSFFFFCSSSISRIYERDKLDKILKKILKYHHFNMRDIVIGYLSSLYYLKFEIAFWKILLIFIIQRKLFMYFFFSQQIYMFFWNFQRYVI